MNVPTGALAALGSRLSVQQLALGRVAAGAGMIVRPTALPRLLGVDSAAATRTAWSVQMLGARDLALGLGTWTSLRRGDARGTRLWLAAGLLSDAVDLLAVGAAAAKGRVSKGGGLGTAAVAGGAVYLQLAALREPDKG